MTLRPCSCDKFVPRRPFRPGRDCQKCWLFAHRAPVRKAWGGDSAETLPLDVPRADMPVEQLADLLAEHPPELPEGWKFWPVTRKAHLLLVERALAAILPYPEGKFAGRGAVICGGGRYEASAYVCIKMLQHVGWQHPIQLWHRGEDEPVSHRIRNIPGVEIVDAEAHPARRGRHTISGWTAKQFAVLHSPFEEVLYIDADAYPVYNPDVCFEAANNPHGIVTWPDASHADEAVHWPTYDLSPDNEPALQGGHYIVAKRQAWRMLQLAGHYDDHCDFYYWWSTDGVKVGAFSDQEHLRIALHKLGVPHHRYTKRPLAVVSGCYIQAGPGGRPLFVHRTFGKFASPGDFGAEPQWLPNNPMEAIAWSHFLDWLTAPAEPRHPHEAPGLISDGEFDLWSAWTRDRDVLELGRYHGRSTVAAAWTARSVVSLDRASATQAETWLQRFNLRHKVWLREGEFRDLVPTSGGPFSACFIDGAHDYQSVRTDILSVLPHLTDDAILGFHDYGDPAFPGVKVAVDEAAARLGWEFIEQADHLAVFQT